MKYSNLQSVYLIAYCLLLAASPLVAQEVQQRIQYAAPEECLAYIAWDGSPEQAIEGNRTQSLVAEPEVRHFLDDLKERAGLVVPAMLSDSRAPKLQIELAHWMSPRVVSAVTERSGCLFIEKISVPRSGDRQPEIEAAMVLDIGKDASKFVKRMASMFKVTGRACEKVELAGGVAYRVDLKDQPATICFGSDGSLVVIAVGEQAYAGTITRSQATDVPPWLAQLQQKASKLQHVHSLGYLNGRETMRAVKKIVGTAAGSVAEVLGLADVQNMEMLGGLDETGSVVHFLVDAKQLDGILGLLARHSLDPKLLGKVPSDALLAYTVSLDASELLDWIVAVETLANGGRSEFEAFNDSVKNFSEIDVKQDLIQNLGRSWTLYCGASDGLIGGLILAGNAKDGEAVGQGLEKIFEFAAESSRNDDPWWKPSFFRQQCQGHTIFSVQYPFFTAEPSFCVADDQVLVGLFPSSVRSAIYDLPANEILFDAQALTDFAKSQYLPGQPKLSGLLYGNPKNQLESVYPILQMTKSVWQNMGAFSQSDSLNFSGLLSGVQLPPLRIAARHLGPTVTALRASDGQLEIEVRQTIPTNAVATGLPLLAGSLASSLGSVGNAAKSTESLNNLRQLALASLNYESATMKFPSNTTVAGGEHQFSWRVHILPYIEEGQLYGEFRFNEPWDSPHNKDLLERMPAVFKAPHSTADAGMTVYRGFAGDGSVLGGADGEVTFASIADGSSNTILVAEVDDQHATPWTKPECLDGDGKLAEVIFGDRKTTRVAMCDGSTFLIRAGVEEEVLNNLISRNDGNLVNIDDLTGAARAGRRSEKARPVDPRFQTPGLKKRM